MRCWSRVQVCSHKMGRQNSLPAWAILTCRIILQGSQRWAVQVPCDVGNVNDNKHARHASLVNVMLCGIQTQRDWIPVTEVRRTAHKHTHRPHLHLSFQVSHIRIKSRCDSIHLVLGHKSDCALLAFRALDEIPVQDGGSNAPQAVWWLPKKAPEQQCGNNSLPTCSLLTTVPSTKTSTLALMGYERDRSLTRHNAHSLIHLRTFNGCTGRGSDKCYKSLCSCKCWE